MWSEHHLTCFGMNMIILLAHVTRFHHDFSEVFPFGQDFGPPQHEALGTEQ